MPISGKSIWIDVEGPIVERPLAFLFETEDGQKWIPKSQIGGRRKDGEKIVRLEVSLWWAKTECLVDEKDDV